MKRPIVSFAVAAGIALLLGAGAVWNEYLRVPPVERLPLSANLIALESTAGQQLLAESDAVADYDDLRAHFVAQSRKAYCGVASAITTLNAGRFRSATLDQGTLFAAPGVKIEPLKVSFTGMSLREFGELLRAHGARTTVVPASAASIDAFRKEAHANLGREGDFLLVNYQRQRLGQERMGHISPLAAYHAATDRVLILDVAVHKYPPVWAPLADVWAAMREPLNDQTSTTRGYVVVHASRSEDIAARKSMAAQPVGRSD